MVSYRRIAIGESAPNAVTLAVERNSETGILASVWWPAHDDVDGDEASFDRVEDAITAAEAAKQLHGFSEIVVTLQSDDLWNPAWGELSDANPLDDAESFELARAMEASRDA